MSQETTKLMLHLLSCPMAIFRNYFFFIVVIVSLMLCRSEYLTKN